MLCLSLVLCILQLKSELKIKRVLIGSLLNEPTIILSGGTVPATYTATRSEHLGKCIVRLVRIVRLSAFYYVCARKSTYPLSSIIDFNMKLKLLPDSFLHFSICKSHRPHFCQSFRGTHVVKSFSTSFGQPPSDPKTSLVLTLRPTSASILTNWF